MSKIVNLATDISIGVQIITTLVGILGLFKTIPANHQILQKILGLETFVQIVELFFYIIFIRSSVLGAMAEIRYFDWFITTPTMLITSAIYYKYEEYLYTNKKEEISIKQFLLDNKKIISIIVIFNALMLLFGYTGEQKILSKTSATIGGFAFFLYSFYILYDRFAKYSPIGNNLFFFMFSIWNIYGIAYLFNPLWKNITFNALDIVAKNFFGIYLYYKVLQKAAP